MRLSVSTKFAKVCFKLSIPSLLEQQKTIQELKFRLRIVNEDKTYYEEYALEAKKENKALKEELLAWDKRGLDDIRLQTPDSEGRATSSHLKLKNYLTSQSVSLKRGATPQQYTSPRQPARSQLIGV